MTSSLIEKSCLPSPLLPDSTVVCHIRYLLRSNSQPPEHIPSLISELSDELARYDEEVSQYEGKIERLQECLIQAKINRATLKAYHDDCCGLFSPIRRLPSELLVDIFALCAHGPDPAFPEPLDFSDVLPYIMSRLAQALLLKVAHVCHHWHGIALETVTFWDTIELTTADMWLPKHVDRSMRLLRSALERGRSSLLTLTVGIITYLPALDLLVGHSKRWKTVYLSCPNTDLRYLRRVAGKLPFLDTLELNTWDTPSNSLDFFERVPRLRKLAVDMSSLSAISLPPLHQLRSFGILGISSTDAVSTVMSFMTRMPPTTQFRLQLFLSNWTDDDTLSVPQTSASITELSMELSDYCDGEHCVQALGDIFAAVTLPCLRELAFNSMEYPYSLMHWAHTPFLGLSKRSEFHTRLQSLRLCHVVITETELLAALAALPVLQQLEIADHDCIQNVPVTLHLLTDTLFSRLTLDPNQPSLVPDLRSLICHSLLQFNDNTYLALLLSRRGHSPPFVNRMSWLEGHNRELDPLVMARLHELQRRGELFCEFSSADLTY